ncbi:MAG: hypothetical protein ACU85U_22030 [Gammaproteobacteria bacterium]|jgi:hypothetical protein
MNARDKSRSSRMPLIGPPPGKHQMPTSAAAMSEMEGRLLGDLDLEKLSDLAEVLFALNNYRIGPMPGFYVAIEVTPGKEWCVGQLCADRAKPLKVFDKRVYKKPESAQRAAQRMRESDLAAMREGANAPKRKVKKRSIASKKVATRTSAKAAKKSAKKTVTRKAAAKKTPRRQA